MLALNPQEKRAILFLLTTLLAGAGIKYTRNIRQQRLNSAWSAAHDSLFTVFRQQAVAEEFPAESIAHQPVQKTDLIFRVNINTASVRQLQTLVKIGPALAQRIVDYRKENGSFKTIEDIQNVRGIGRKTFDKIKDHITVD
ncbi:helix-hairpin-helix domain-containing protein [candidate division KSB1 bacterium]|nr:helix-hairpin-helix domain-containing protein [candidate division KSB1 bacterium]